MAEWQNPKIEVGRITRESGRGATTFFRFGAARHFFSLLARLDSLFFRETVKK
jgi:hypothetical protein